MGGSKSNGSAGAGGGGIVLAQSTAVTPAQSTAVTPISETTDLGLGMTGYPIITFPSGASRRNFTGTRGNLEIAGMIAHDGRNISGQQTLPYLELRFQDSLSNRSLRVTAREWNPDRGSPSVSQLLSRVPVNGMGFDRLMSAFQSLRSSTIEVEEA